MTRSSIDSEKQRRRLEKALKGFFEDSIEYTEGHLALLAQRRDAYLTSLRG
jgi:hypothetical protein